MKIAIATINKPSLESAKKLLPVLKNHECTVFNKSEEGDGFVIFGKVDEIMAPAWANFDAIIFIMATGAVIRKIAPHLKDKATDPAVLIMTLDLKRVIPLLSGHLGGANELAVEITDTLEECVNFVTTASDQIKVLAFDMFAKKMGYDISHLKSLAVVANRIINKEIVQVVSYPCVIEEMKNFEGYAEGSILFFTPDDLAEFDTDIPTVYITPQRLGHNALQFHPKEIVLGLGMNRGTEEKEIALAVKRFCYEHSLEETSITCLASFDAKADEVGLLAYATSAGKELRFFNDEAINALEQEFSPSKATKFFNIKGVAEPASLLASQNKTLFLSKKIYGNVTVAASF
ncbi:cobalamin biosynthesis protein [Sulfurimonas sp. SAG-AH-194-I05]|nr:cobalamin biosynthesis protein [Sulfurimonas sp. SAG-AH-194-I05]MDF1875895.1 cobalamin biosynthesis protein [Sulfurimonas sp. SAG-AH-194-I05]